MPDMNHALEDYLASLPDEDWQALCARVRPPEAPEVDRGAIAAAESEGRWRDAGSLKAAQLWQQINDENRKLTEG